jgi:UDP-glucose-4-epimerase GalE
MVKMLAEAGAHPTTFDNLSRGHREAVVAGELVEGDLLCPDDLKALFRKKAFDIVMHFGAFCYVGESVANPRAYYGNNVAGTLNLLDAMLDAGADKIVFSSSCATYGVPQAIPIGEDHPQHPVNPYGRTKLMVEHVLQDYAHSYGLKSIALRYFNAAGCDPEGTLGELHDPETHLIPLVLREALRVMEGGDPEDTALLIFGDDFDTPDGTCIRDYIHVGDLCSAHLCAAGRLAEESFAGAEAYNLGNGKGFSVKEVIAACRRVTTVDIRFKVVGRRSGDPHRLVGSALKAERVLGWTPRITALEDIVGSAWRWYSGESMRVTA